MVFFFSSENLKEINFIYIIYQNIIMLKKLRGISRSINGLVTKEIFVLSFYQLAMNGSDKIDLDLCYNTKLNTILSFIL